MNDEVVIDCGISYWVTKKEMKKHYKGFDKLSDEEQYELVIEYVKTKLFKVDDLIFNCDDFND